MLAVDPSFSHENRPNVTLFFKYYILGATKSACFHGFSGDSGTGLNAKYL